MELKKRSEPNACCKYFQEYCTCSSIHGIKYLGETDRSFAEKLWWLASFTTCMYLCAIMILKVYNKWETSPVIVTFATKETPIYEIPFPAVTICPETKSARNILNFTRLLHTKQDNEIMTPKEKLYFDHMSLVCEYSDLNFSNNKTMPGDIYDTLEQVAPKFLNWTKNCEWMGKSYKCSDIFTPIITDEGLCYTFNMLDRDDLFREFVHNRQYYKTNTKPSSWTFEHGYDKDSGKTAYPRRALLAGATHALNINMVSLKSDIDYACTSLQGYKVLFHTPARIPRPSQEYLRISLDEAFIATIQPSMIKTSEAVKNYDPKKRDCSLPSERYLYYFKIYSQINCQLECLTNFTLKYCGCVNFFMPHENETRICGIGSVNCMRHAERKLLTAGLDHQFNKSHESTKIYSAIDDCNCLPLCTDLSYNAHISQTDWDWAERYQALRLKNFTVSKKSLHMSSLSIFFKFNHFITSERNELFGPTDFLANFGGLLGLFTGFSILSVIEIVYFLSLRPLCNLKIFN